MLKASDSYHAPGSPSGARTVFIILISHQSCQVGKTNSFSDWDEKTEAQSG